MKFEDLGFNSVLLENIKKENYEVATGIQELVIPLILDGKDVVGVAQTGTGKTAAFVLPILENMIRENHELGYTKVLVMSPTRELAIQTRDAFKDFGAGLDYRSIALLGGVKTREQASILKKGMDIIVATPGRLLDLLDRHKVDLSRVEYLVLDEADTMLDMGFINDIKTIIKHLPSQRETMLFSATMAPAIEALTTDFMNNPINVKVEATEVPTIIDQKVYFVDRDNKVNLLFDILNTREPVPTLIFTRTKIGADKLEREFNDYGIKVSVIHGDKRQSNRARALKDFKEGKTYILIATDIAARGIDINGLTQVINFDIPEFAEDYVHRIGRTGRAGIHGTSFTFCSSNEIYRLKNIQELTKMDMEEVEHAYPMTKKPSSHSDSRGRRSRTDKGSNYKKDDHKDFKRNDHKDNDYKRRDNDFKKKEFDYKFDKDKVDYGKKNYPKRRNKSDVNNNQVSEEERLEMKKTRDFRKFNHDDRDNDNSRYGDKKRSSNYSRSGSRGSFNHSGKSDSRSHGSFNHSNGSRSHGSFSHSGNSSLRSHGSFNRSSNRSNYSNKSERA